MERRAQEDPGAGAWEATGWGDVGAIRAGEGRVGPRQNAAEEIAAMGFSLERAAEALRETHVPGTSTDIQRAVEWLVAAPQPAARKPPPSERAPPTRAPPKGTDGRLPVHRIQRFGPFEPPPLGRYAVEAGARVRSRPELDSPGLGTLHIGHELHAVASEWLPAAVGAGKGGGRSVTG